MTLYDFIDRHYASLFIVSCFFSAVILMTAHDIAITWIQRERVK
jgi:hypothetical protein